MKVFYKAVALVVAFSLVAVAQADSQELESGCRDPFTGNVYGYGDVWAPADGSCELYTCLADGAVSVCSCATVKADPGCTLVYPAGAYPQCCPRVECPPGVKRISTLLSYSKTCSPDADGSVAKQRPERESTNQAFQTTSSDAISLRENGHENTPLPQTTQQVLDTRDYAAENGPTREPNLQLNQQSALTQYTHELPVEENLERRSSQPPDNAGYENQNSDRLTSSSPPPHHTTTIPYEQPSAAPTQSRQHQHHQHRPLGQSHAHGRTTPSSSQDRSRPVPPFTPRDDSYAQRDYFPPEPRRRQTPTNLQELLAQLLPQLDIFRPMDPRVVMSSMNPGWDPSKPEAPIVIFGDFLKLFGGASQEEMLKRILPPNVNPTMPINLDDLLRLLIPGYKRGQTLTPFELLIRILSQLPSNIFPNLFQQQQGNRDTPSLGGLQYLLSGSRQINSGPQEQIDRFVRSLLSSGGLQNNQNNLPGPISVLLQRNPTVLLSDFGPRAQQGQLGQLFSNFPPNGRDLDQFSRGGR